MSCEERRVFNVSILTAETVIKEKSDALICNQVDIYSV